MRAANDETARLRAKLNDEGDKLALAKAVELENFKVLTTSRAEAAALAAQVRDDSTRYGDAVWKLESEVAALRAEISETAGKLAVVAGERDTLRNQVKDQDTQQAALCTEGGNVPVNWRRRRTSAMCYALRSRASFR